jgi:hypothetical protein
MPTQTRLHYSTVSRIVRKDEGKETQEARSDDHLNARKSKIALFPLLFLTTLLFLEA